MQANRARSITPPFRRPLATDSSSSAPVLDKSTARPDSKRQRKTIVQSSSSSSPTTHHNSAASSSMRAFSSSSRANARQAPSRGHRPPPRPAKSQRTPALLSLPQPDNPVHDERWVHGTYTGESLKQSLVTNPKSTISNWCVNNDKGKIEYTSTPINIHNKAGFRYVSSC
jgi:hypothetical protein